MSIHNLDKIFKPESVAIIGANEKEGSILQRSSVPIFVIDNEHNITHWNRACENLTGISANEIIGTRNQWMAFYSAKRSSMADLIVENASGEEIAAHYADKCCESAVIDGAYETESTGIGLSLCHRIITDHDGSLSVSENRWGGAEFTIKLSIKKPEYPAPRTGQC